jgi:uncharacterized repeat protein (TIGR01451 family)
MKTPQRARSARATVMLAAGLTAVTALMGASHPQGPSGTPATGKTSATTRVPATASAPGTRAARVPGLAVTVSDGHVAARAGEVLTYLVTVRDIGATAAPRLEVIQTLSAGLKVLSVSDHGMAASGRVTWPVGLAAGGSRTFRVLAQVTSTPATLLRLAAVACVALAGKTRPIICAAHLDRLPAATMAVSRPGRSGMSAAAYAAIGLAVAALCLLAAIARRRGRLRRQPA